MKTTTRHSIDAGLAQRQKDLQQRVLDATIGPARSNPELLDQLFLNALDHACSTYVVDPSTATVCDDLKLAAQAARALFAVARPPGEEVTVPLGEGHARYATRGPNPSAHAGNWRLGFFAAAIVRDRTVLDELASTPLATLRASSSRVDECVHRFVEALQSIWRRQPDAGARIQAALEATDASMIGVSGASFVLNLLVPEIELTFRWVERDAAKFNEALARSLEQHKKYWNTAARKRDALGWLALGPVALAAFAHDSDLTVTVESSYLPRRWFADLRT